MNLAMIVIHTPASAAHHHGGGVNAAAPVHHSTVMTLATTLAAVEVVAAAAVLYYRTRAVRPTSQSVDGRRLDAGPASSASGVAPACRSEGPHVGVTPPQGALRHAVLIRGTQAANTSV